MMDASRPFFQPIAGLALTLMLLMGPRAALGGDADVAGDVIRVRGRVIDPSGRPVAGAKVTVPSAGGWDHRLDRRPIAQATSGDNGRFEIRFDKAEVSPFTTGGGSPGLDNWKQTPVVASGDGLGMAFQSWRKTDAKGDLVLQLVPDDAPIEGRILDLEGQPVGGVNVIVHSIGPADDKVIEEAYRKERDSVAHLVLGLPLLAAGNDTPIVSDADGRFTVRGLGRDRKVNLYLHGEKIGYARLEVVTREMEPQIRVVPQPSGIVSRFVTYGARFDFTATPGRTVRGVITDAATKQPMAGVNVQSLRFAGPFQGFDPQGMISCVTDPQGRYVLHGFPKGKENHIIAVPGDDQPYFMREASVEDEPGLAPVTVDLELHKGVFVTGKVTDEKTGRPLAARLIYSTYVENPHTHALPEFRRTGNSASLDGYQSRYETKAGGVYRIVAAPGKALIGAWCMLDGYRTGTGFDALPVFKEKNFVLRMYQPNFYRESTNVVKEVDVPVGAESVTCDLQLDPGETVKVAIVGPDGKPAKGPFHVRGHEPENYGGWYGRRIDAPEFEAVGFGPGDERTLLVFDEAGALGRAQLVKFDALKERTITVELQPLAEVRGRVLDKEGDPLSSLQLEPEVLAPNGRSLDIIRTDRDGRFSTPLLPGAKYYLRVWGGPYAGRNVGDNIDPRPAQKLDLGDVRIEPLMMQ